MELVIEMPGQTEDVKQERASNAVVEHDKLEYQGSAPSAMVATNEVKRFWTSVTGTLVLEYPLSGDIKLDTPNSNIHGLARVIEANES